MEVYKITNKLNGKCYVGKTIRKASYRWSRHLQSRAKSCAIANALKKYGKTNFTFEVLVTNVESETELARLERSFITELNCVAPDGYNLTSGGEGSGTQYSEASKAKMRSSSRHVKSFLGRKHSSETKKLLAELSRGKSPANKGKPLTLDQKAKMSAALTGKKSWNKGHCLYQVKGPNVVYSSLQEAAQALQITVQAVRLRCKRRTDWELVVNDIL